MIVTSHILLLARNSKKLWLVIQCYCLHASWHVGENDLRVVKNEVLPVTARYPHLGVELDIPPFELEKLKSLRMEEAFSETLLKWLRGCSTKSPPTPPSWRSLVKAVDSPSGGNNHALAKVIASRHKAQAPQAQAPQAPQDQGINVGHLENHIQVYHTLCSNIEFTPSCRYYVATGDCCCCCVCCFCRPRTGWTSRDNQNAIILLCARH